MSSTTHAWTFDIDDSRIPADARAIVPLLQWMEDNGGAVRSDSRSDWHMSTLGEVLRASPADGLAFLDVSRATRGRDEAGRLWTHAVLPHAAIEPAQRQLDALLARALDDTAFFVPFFAGVEGGLSVDAIRAGREHPASVDGDDGVGPAYFFDHLVSLRQLLKYSRGEGRSVIHIAFPPQ
jgi:hypothetical protein